MEFSVKLKKLRNDMKWSQEKLAQKVNTSRSNIANYENNKNMPSIEMQKKLADVFNVSVDYLMGYSNVIKINDTIYIDKQKIVEGLMVATKPNSIKLNLEEKMDIKNRIDNITKNGKEYTDFKFDRLNKLYDELNDDEKEEVLQYIEFLKSKKKNK